MLSYGNSYSLKWFPMGAIHVEYIFQLYFYIFLARFIALKIDCAVVCLLFAVKMARFANFIIIIIMLNLNVFFSLDVVYYSYYFLLPREHFFFLKCCLVMYSALAVGSGTIPHQTTLCKKKFPHEKTIIEYITIGLWFYVT